MVTTRVTVYKKGKIYQDWLNSAYTFIYINEFEANHINWLYPVVLFDNPGWDCFLGKDKIAIRTDAYPLLWAWIMFWVHCSAKVDSCFSKIMKFCNRKGIAKTPLGSIPSFKDFLWWFREK